jgi:hypothetical protein
MSRDQIKLIIRDLEREIGINETLPVNMALVQALREIELLERA